MRAISYDRYGPARDVLTLMDWPERAPGPGEVRVALAFSGVNPSDVKRRAGARGGETAATIPHSDGAGRIVAVGAGVPDARVGERVWIWNGQWQRDEGTCAEAITLPADQAVPLPDTVAFETGAVMGIPGLTACYTVFGHGDVTGQSVLVQGAGGTVGYLAAQLALWGGARVIATARGAGAERVRALGVPVVDFTAADAAERILAANDGQPIDRIVEVEFGLNAELDAAVIAENGVICAYGSAGNMTPALPFYPLMFKAVTLEMALIYLLTPHQRARTIDRLTKALTAGALHCPVAEVFALAETAAAHEAVERGERAGAVLVRTGEG